jgi:hypothetical protein
MMRKAFLIRVIRVLPPLSSYIIIRESLRVNTFITLSTSAMKNNNRKPLYISCGAVASRIYLITLKQIFEHPIIVMFRKT